MPEANAVRGKISYSQLQKNCCSPDYIILEIEPDDSASGLCFLEDDCLKSIQL